MPAAWQACFIVYITRLLSAHLPVSFYLFSVLEDKPCTGHRQSACAFLRHDDKIKEETRIRREGKEKILCDIRHFRTCSCPRWAWAACVCRCSSETARSMNNRRPAWPLTPWRTVSITSTLPEPTTAAIRKG